jgi:hypothetical protein
MKQFFVFAVVFFLAGCAASNQPESFYLASSPQPNGCIKPECKELDLFESQGYTQAREGKISWVKFVSQFYQLRDKLFPKSNDNPSLREYKAYQMLLAEQRDAKKISEAEWEYLMEKKFNELNARDQMVRNTQQPEPLILNIPQSPQPTALRSCVTQKIGQPPFESFQTQCN